MKDETICALADDPAQFAQRVLALLEDPQAAELTARARLEVETTWDMGAAIALEAGGGISQTGARKTRYFEWAGNGRRGRVMRR